MSRIRSIKPEFWTSTQILECSTNARLLFIGLWNFCDDTGRHPYSAKQAKAEVFPADDFTEEYILGLLQELSTNDLITVYVSGGKQYFYVSGWKHQRIDKPQSPKYPDPFSDNSKTIPRILPPDTIRYDTIGKDTIGEDNSLSLRSSDVAHVETDDWPKDYREQFWSQYPRRIGRKAAFKKLETIRKSGEVTFAKLMAGIAKIPIGEPRFTPHPTTWLAQGRWDDEQQHGNGASNGTTSPADRAYRLAEQARQLELASGIGRPSDAVGGNGISGELIEPVPKH